ncbi:MAG: hypothetical protein DMF84_06695 [Acidobacteria bacterium]|nr:MAG: hypothetical protein DMF84_06695 [Acidobacteriota bacterium]
MGWAPSLLVNQAPAAGGFVVIPKRFVIAACVCLATATLWPSEALAQRRVGHVRPVRSVVVLGGGFFYNPFFYYSPFYWGGWYPGFGYGGYPSAPYGYGYGYGPAISEARLQIKPRDAEVFVDGYYVGRVDNFDGVFQRLDLPPGEHEITVYRDGYRTYRQKNLFRPGEGYKFQATLEPLAAGEAQEPRPRASATPPAQQPPYGQPGPYPSGPERGRTMPIPERRAGERTETGGFGTLNVRVQPADATVTIDGERWDSPEGGSRLQVQLAVGRHQIEVRKDGFKPYSTSVDIRAGETETVNVSLPAGREQ